MGVTKTGAAAAALFLIAGTALAQAAWAQTSPGQGLGGNTGAGASSANCPAGSNAPGCSGGSQLGPQGSTWGTGGSAGAGASGSTWESGSGSGSGASSGVSGNAGRTPAKIDPRNPPQGPTDPQQKKQ